MAIEKGHSKAMNNLGKKKIKIKKEKRYEELKKLNEKYLIFIQIESLNKTIEIKILNYLKIKDLKLLIEKQENINFSKQILVFKDDILNDEKFIFELENEI